MTAFCKWMLVIMFLNTSHGFLLEPECMIEDDVLNCTCTDREDIVIRTLMGHSVVVVEIHHCGHVTIHNASFVGLKLQYILLDDLLSLDIKPWAFLGIGTLDNLLISNIQLLKNNQYSIHADHVSKVLFKNVHSEALSRDFLSIDSVGHFLMTDCFFRIVDSEAIHLNNAQYVFVMNSSLDVIQKDGFIFNGTTTQLYFQNTSFKFVEREAFKIQHLIHLTFSNCSFDLIQSSFIVGPVTNFAFNNNQVNTIEAGAFLKLNVTYFHLFNFNLFRQAEEGFQLLLSYPSSNVTIENNTFVCDCQMSWIWNSSLRNTSYCEDEYNKIYPMKDLKVKGRCTDVVNVDSDNQTILDDTELFLYDMQNVKSDGSGYYKIDVVWSFTVFLFQTILKIMVL